MMIAVSPPKSIIFGISGFLGRYFYRFYKNYYPDVIGYGKAEGIPFDLLDPKVHPDHFKGVKYGIIAAGISKVLRCEKEKDHSYRVNVDGVLKLAKIIIENGATPIIFSTNYVFDGKSDFYYEDSLLFPLNEYGKQKAEVEQKMKQLFPGKYIIIRLDKTYGSVKGDETLIDSWIKKLISRQSIQAFVDHRMCPILVDDVIQKIVFLQENNQRGLFHLGGPKVWTNYQLAFFIALKLGIDTNLVKKIEMRSLKEDLQRPKSVAIKSSKIDLGTLQQIDTTIESLIQAYKQAI